MNLPLLHNDDVLVAIAKPAGYLVHPLAGFRDDAPVCLHLLRDQLGQHLYPVHRLDRPTTGVLLFAKTKPAASALALQFFSGEISKTYVALTRGMLPERGCIDHPLPRSKDGEGKPSLTYYKRLAFYEVPMPMPPYESTILALTMLTPKTGRRHQLRRHLAHVSHPILGDTQHGDGRYNRLARTLMGGEQHLYLHASHLAFTHPSTGLPVNLCTPLEPPFSRLLEKISSYKKEPPAIEGNPLNPQISFSDKTIDFAGANH